MALSRLHERLAQQRGLYEVLIPLGSPEGIRAPPGCNDQLVDGIPLGSGDIHANAFPVQQYRSYGFVDQEVQEPQVFSRRASRAGIGDGLPV